MDETAVMLEMLLVLDTELEKTLDGMLNTALDTDELVADEMDEDVPLLIVCDDTDADEGGKEEPNEALSLLICRDDACEEKLKLAPDEEVRDWEAELIADETATEEKDDDEEIPVLMEPEDTDCPGADVDVEETKTGPVSQAETIIKLITVKTIAIRFFINSS